MRKLRLYQNYSVTVKVCITMYCSFLIGYLVKVNELLGPASLNYGEHMYYVLETNEVTVPCQANGDYAAKLLNRYGVFLGVSGDPVDGPFGTPAVPAIVPTFHEGRIAACMGSAEHSHEILYFHIEKDSTCRCSECNQVFKAIQPELIVTVLPLETVAAVHDDATAAWKSFHSQAGDVEEVKPHLVHEYLHKIVDVYDNAKVKINEHDLKKMEELGLVALSEAGIEDSDALWNKAAALGATDKTRFHSLARLAQINREPVDVARIVETLKTPFDSTAVDEKRASDETFKDVKMMAHSDREDLTEAFAPIKSMMLAFVEVYSGKMSTPSIPEQAELSTILKGMDEAGLRELINIDTANAAFEEMRGKSSEDIAKVLILFLHVH